MENQDNKVREMSHAEQEAYSGKTFDASTGEETSSAQQDRQERPFRLYTQHDIKDFLQPGNIWKYLWQNTTWKTKLIALVTLVLLISGVGLFLTVALPFLLTVAGTLVIIWFVLSLFMRR